MCKHSKLFRVEFLLIFAKIFAEKISFLKIFFFEFSESVTAQMPVFMLIEHHLSRRDTHEIQ